MPLSLADLIRLRDGLIETRLNGARVYVDQNGERIEYRGSDDLLKAIASADAMIASLGAQPIRTLKFNTSKGL